MKGKKGQPGRYASGGGVHEINGSGSPVMELGKKTTSDGFRKGGKVKSKFRDGGLVTGKPAAPRLDKPTRGGKFASGGAVMSSASKQKDRESGSKSAGAGHEDVGSGDTAE